MKVRSDKVTIGLNGNRYVKGTVFECNDEDGDRLIKQGTVVRVDIPAPAPIEVPKVTEPPQTVPEATTPAEDEFKKVGGRWKKSKVKGQSP